MKKIILTPLMVCALFAGIELSAQDNKAPVKKKSPAKEAQKKEAQPKRPMEPHERGRMSAERAQKRYGLNEEQKNSWEVAAMQRAVENRNLREQMKMAASPEEKKAIREQARQNHSQFESTVMMFLTEEQKVKFRKDLKDREQKRKAAMKNKKKPSEADADEEVFSEEE